MNITFYDKNNRPWTFLHVPKTAGKSISAYIMKHSNNAKTLHELSHATVNDMNSLGVDLGTTFAVFRNPYSRAVSLYKFLYEVDLEIVTKSSLPFFQKSPDFTWHTKLIKETGKLNFLEFCKLLPHLPLGIEQHHYLPVSKRLRIECLDVDFKFIQTMLGTNEPLYTLNNTDTLNWKNYYNDETQDIIYETYKKDFELLGYSININNSSI